MADDGNLDDGTLHRERTLAVVLAASEWPAYPEFSPAASFRRSAQDIADYICSSSGMGLPSANVRVQIDAFEGAAEIMHGVRRFIRQRREHLKAYGKPVTDLLLYYVGHGGFGEGNAFFLSVRATDEDDPLSTSITADSLGRLIREDAHGLRTYLVLDCCFAAAVTKVFMAGGALEVAGVKLHDALPPQGDAADGAVARPEYGTALLCASGPREPALAPPNLTHTMFTGGLLQVLREGDPASPPWLSLDDLQRLVRSRLAERFKDKAVLPQLHAPHQRAGRVDLMPLFRNPARHPADAATEAALQPVTPLRPENLQPGTLPEVPAKPEKPDRNWTRPVLAGVTTLAAILALLWFVPHWLHPVPPPDDPVQERTVTAAEAVIRGESLRKSGQFTNAARLFKFAAGQGDADGQVLFGFLNEKGLGVPQSFTEAFRLYKLAADQGNAKGQAYLGALYRFGRGVPQSYTEALRLYKLAADQGNPIGQAYLGSLYETGHGVPQSYAEALRLYKLAADQGNPVGQAYLGLLYDNGHGVPQSYAEALRLYKLAADQGNPVGQTFFGWLFENGHGVPKSHAEAFRFYRLAADQGDATGQVRLGALYAAERGVPLSEDEAFRLFKLAADQGDTMGQVHLGASYENGQGVQQSYPEALRLFRLAAAEGDPTGQAYLGELYATGRGVQQSYSEALRLFKLAAGQDDPAGQTFLGGLYEGGHGVQQSTAKAVDLYKKAARQGNTAAQAALNRLGQSW